MQSWCLPLWAQTDVSGPGAKLDPRAGPGDHPTTRTHLELNPISTPQIRWASQPKYVWIAAAALAMWTQTSLRPGLCVVVIIPRPLLPVWTWEPRRDWDGSHSWLETSLAHSGSESGFHRAGATKQGLSAFVATGNIGWGTWCPLRPVLVLLVFKPDQKITLL